MKTGLDCHFQSGMGPSPCGYSWTNTAGSDPEKSRHDADTKVMVLRTPTCQAEHPHLLAIGPDQALSGSDWLRCSNDDLVVQQLARSYRTHAHMRSAIARRGRVYWALGLSHPCQVYSPS
jgi:hypothetical protein